VREGTILSIRCEKQKVGKTSVTYMVTVHDVQQPGVEAIFATEVTLVNVDEEGSKVKIGPAFARG
jgi:acyl-CoA thioesterase FadM